VLVLWLLRHQPLDQAEKPGEPAFQHRVAGDLTGDIAVHAAQIGAQLPERAAHPAELPSVGMPSGPHHRRLGQARVALP
jgi:hypothetical protein